MALSDRTLEITMQNGSIFHVACKGLVSFSAPIFVERSPSPVVVQKIVRPEGGEVEVGPLAELQEKPDVDYTVECGLTDPPSEKFPEEQVREALALALDSFERMEPDEFTQWITENITWDEIKSSARMVNSLAGGGPPIDFSAMWEDSRKP